ncbi:MAG: DUF2262 domain-containing protein [Sphingomonadaceae bacterium]
MRLLPVAILACAVLLLFGTLPAPAAAQETTGQVITGVVDGMGGNTVQIEGEEHSTLSVTLVAWQIGDGPIQTSSLEALLQGNFDPDAAYEAMDATQARTLIAFVAKGPIRQIVTDQMLGAGNPATQQVDIERLIATKENPALLQAADTILNPPDYFDEHLGTFTANHIYPLWFDQTRAWQGTAIKVTLNTETASLADCSATLVRIVSQEAELNKRMRQTIESRLYPRWLEQSHTEQHSGLSRQDWLKTITPKALYINANGFFMFNFDAGNLFGGKGITVSGDSPTGPLSAFTS